MTHLQLDLAHFAYKLSQIVNNLLNSFKDIAQLIIDGRQEKANRIVAEQLKFEYPNESFSHILHLVEKGRIDEIHK